MHLSADLVRLHLDYSSWASRRLLEMAARLAPNELTRDFGTADRSVLGTLVHIFAADRTWLARLSGRTPGPFSTDADYRLDVLESGWPAVLDGWKNWAAGLADQDVDAAVRYADLRGREWVQPLWQPVLHVVNHATHHRGQVSGFLRSMGHAPPPLDLIAYYRAVTER